MDRQGFEHQRTFSSEPYKKPKTPYSLVLPKSMIDAWTKAYGYNCGFDPERVTVVEHPLFDNKKNK